jgi:hypothetical protein
MFTRTIDTCCVYAIWICIFYFLYFYMKYVLNLPHDDKLLRGGLLKDEL